jgi:hypothetical protein
VSWKSFHEESIKCLRGVDSQWRHYVAPIPGLSIVGNTLGSVVYAQHRVDYINDDNTKNQR